MIVGVDIGYSSTKTSEDVLFQSKISEVDTLSECASVTIDGKKYNVGKGIGLVDVNKIESELTRVCLFTALAMSTPLVNTFKVVTGLPIGQYKKQAEQLKEMITKNNRCRINYKGIDRNILIEDVKIYAQGAGALFAQPIIGNAIVIDIGYRTIDIALFEVEGNKRNLITYSTLFNGVLPLSSKVIAEVNSCYNLALPCVYGEQIMRDGLMVDGEKQDIEFVKHIKLEHLKELFEELESKYPGRTTQIYLCGGGAYLLGNCIKSKYKNAILLPNAQFCNAKGFKRIGEKIWQ